LSAGDGFCGTFIVELGLKRITCKLGLHKSRAPGRHGDEFVFTMAPVIGPPPQRNITKPKGTALSRRFRFLDV
jgi:hypothetical protein